MTTLVWIIASGLLMSAVALIGSVTLFLSEATLKKILLPLVALAAGTLLGGAFLHMIPAAIEKSGNRPSIYLWTLLGFTLFLALEQFLHWHHCHRAPSEHRPLTYLILIADGVHNFIGGLAVAGAFLIDVRVGISTWLAAAAHEVPQELGDFGILIHGGWNKTKALLYNFLSALTFLVGGIVAYSASFAFDVTFLLPFAAGNFIYIAAADLIPEIKHEENAWLQVVHFLSFLLGLALLFLVVLVFED
ncbi:MAG TPA: ZIP family metal transporter [Candidatus Limnocylindria bacterium]|nr:ZIP family metal transporter [Candidatus Limnocylindria bacterium]